MSKGVYRYLKRRLPLLLPVLLLTSSATMFLPTVAALGHHWLELATAAHNAEMKGNFDLSIELWKQALAEAKTLGENHPWYSIALRNISHNSLLKFDLETAEAFARHEYEILSSIGDGYPDLVYDLVLLGRIDAMNGCWQRSRQEYEHALKLCFTDPQPLGVVPGALANSLVTFRATRDAENQRKYLARLISILTRKNSPAVAAQTLCSLAARIFEDSTHARGTTQDFLDTADDLYTQALTIASGSTDAACLTEQARALKLRAAVRTAKHESAAAYQDALQAIEKLEKLEKLDYCSKRHLEIYGEALREAGESALQIGQWSKAEELFQKRISFVKQHHGNVIVVSVLNQTGNSFGAVQQLAKAITYHERARDLLKKLTAEEMPPRLRITLSAITLQTLARLNRQKGIDRFAESAKLYREAEVMSEKLGRTEQMARNLADYAELYYWLGQYSKAKPILIRSIEIFAEMKNLQPEFWQAIALSRLASIESREGSYDQAEQHFQQAFSVFRRLPKENQGWCVWANQRRDEMLKKKNAEL